MRVRVPPGALGDPEIPLTMRRSSNGRTLASLARCCGFKSRRLDCGSVLRGCRGLEHYQGVAGSNPVASIEGADKQWSAVAGAASRGRGARQSQGGAAGRVKSCGATGNGAEGARPVWVREVAGSNPASPTGPAEAKSRRTFSRTSSPIRQRRMAQTHVSVSSTLTSSTAG